MGRCDLGRKVTWMTFWVLSLVLFGCGKQMAKKSKGSETPAEIRQEAQEKEGESQKREKEIGNLDSDPSSSSMANSVTEPENLASPESSSGTIAARNVGEEVAAHVLDVLMKNQMDKITKYMVICTKEESCYLFLSGKLLEIHDREDGFFQIISDFQQKADFDESLHPLEIASTQLSYYLIRQKKRDSFNSLWKTLRDQYGSEFGVKEFVEVVNEVCFTLKNADCLTAGRLFLEQNRNQVSRSEYSSLRAEIYYGLSLISTNFLHSLSLVRTALQLIDNHEGAFIHSQIMHLEVLHRTLVFYQSELQKAQIFRFLGLENMEDGDLTVKEALLDASFHTVGLLRFIFFGENLQEDWTLAMNQLQCLVAYSGYWLSEMRETVSPGADLSFFSTPRKLCHSLSWDLEKRVLRELVTSRFMSELILYGYVSEMKSPQTENEEHFLPVVDLADFGQKEASEFISPSEFSHLLLNELNLVNVGLIFRGPAYVRRISQFQGVQRAVDLVGLRGLYTAAEKLPGVFRGSALVLLTEAADGCLATWGYFAYSVYTGVTNHEFATRVHSVFEDLNAPEPH